MTEHSLTLPGDLVSTDWLAANLDHPDLRLFDATYFLAHLKRDAEQEFLTRHIPGAQRFDIEAISDHDDPLPHMIPTSGAFAQAVTALGVSNTSRVVAYDALGVMSAARVWWMFRLFGHDQVAVLDGGLPKWLREGRATASGAATARPGVPAFVPDFRQTMVRKVSAIQANLTTPTEQVIDARSAGRFEGRDPEVRPGLRSGHIPGSINLPYTDLQTAEGVMLPPSEIAARFKAAGLKPGAPVVTSCGSGVTACVLALGLKQIGHEPVAVYDGSWTEWGGRADVPVATGPAVG
jgi:thiosulfate/3-mercaptopyruvate sulfurtransferase